MSKYLATVLLLFVFSTFAGEAETKKPNFIFILIDDQGYYDLGCYGATEVKTPRIDAMAKEGIRFTDYYAAAPICSPSRAGLLTGCYPRRVGNEIWVHRADSPTGIHPDELTLAELLKTNGYKTACIGKWHLGFQEPFLPRNQGFDHYLGLLHNLDPVETVFFRIGSRGQSGCCPGSGLHRSLQRMSGITLSLIGFLINHNCMQTLLNQLLVFFLFERLSFDGQVGKMGAQGTQSLGKIAYAHLRARFARNE